MDNKNIKDELEKRVKKIEELIANKGIGSSKLNKARKIQRNVNLVIFLGSLVTVAGIAAWLVGGNDD